LDQNGYAKVRDDYILTKWLKVIKRFHDSFYKTLQRNDTFSGNLFFFNDDLFQLLLVSLSKVGHSNSESNCITSLRLKFH